MQQPLPASPLPPEATWEPEEEWQGICHTWGDAKQAGHPLWVWEEEALRRVLSRNTAWPVSRSWLARGVLSLLPAQIPTHAGAGKGHCLGSKSPKAWASPLEHRGPPSCPGRQSRLVLPC